MMDNFLDYLESTTPEQRLAAGRREPVGRVMPLVVTEALLEQISQTVVCSCDAPDTGAERVHREWCVKRLPWGDLVAIVSAAEPLISAGYRERIENLKKALRRFEGLEAMTERLAVRLAVDRTLEYLYNLALRYRAVYCKPCAGAPCDYTDELDMFADLIKQVESSAAQEILGLPEGVASSDTEAEGHSD